jgi:hypothetical protein
MQPNYQRYQHWNGSPPAPTACHNLGVYASMLPPAARRQYEAEIAALVELRAGHVAALTEWARDAVYAAEDAEAALVLSNEVVVCFGPYAGRRGELTDGPDAGGYYRVQIAGIGEPWLLLPDEFQVIA